MEQSRKIWSHRIAVGVSALALLLHILFRFALHATPNIFNAPLIAALLIGSPALIVEVLVKIAHRDLGSDVLAVISIITSFLLKEYVAGTIILFMLSGGGILEHFAVDTASSVLRALAKRSPSTAHRRKNGDVEDVALTEINEGDILVIFPHETSPVDGDVIEGHGTMDESYLTGEPFQMSKIPGASVYSGAINGETALVIKATKRAVDSRYAKIMQVVKSAEQNPPELRRLGDQLGALAVPVALIVAIAAWVVSGSSTRFLAVLVIATPCPLILAIPIAVIGSISLCARRGIVVRKPVALEQVQLCRTIIFDKTGTLTYGRPELTEKIMATEAKARDVLSMSAGLERYSRHPLAHAIIAAAEKEKIVIADASEISEKPGQGLTGKVNGRTIQIIGRKIYDAMAGTKHAPLPREEGGLESVVLVDGKFAALYRFRDEPRQEGRPFIAHLGPKHQFNKKIILSGDREIEVRYMAEKMGIDEIFAGKSPEEKIAIVEAEMKKAKTIFVGDGVNDAPSLMASTVGIAIGAGSDVAHEAAGVVIMDSSLSKIDEFFHFGQRMRTIALQSAIMGMALSLVGMGFAAFGVITPTQGAIIQEAIDLLAILNALRSALMPRDLTDF
jgi:heavy metal translocating P-type ATPase